MTQFRASILKRVNTQLQPLLMSLLTGKQRAGGCLSSDPCQNEMLEENVGKLDSQSLGLLCTLIYSSLFLFFCSQLLVLEGKQNDVTTCDLVVASNFWTLHASHVMCDPCPLRCVGKEKLVISCNQNLFYWWFKLIESIKTTTTTTTTTIRAPSETRIALNPLAPPCYRFCLSALKLPSLVRWLGLISKARSCLEDASPAAAEVFAWKYGGCEALQKDALVKNIEKPNEPLLFETNRPHSSCTIWQVLVLIDVQMY